MRHKRCRHQPYPAIDIPLTLPPKEQVQRHGRLHIPNNLLNLQSLTRHRSQTSLQLSLHCDTFNQTMATLAQPTSHWSSHIQNSKETWSLPLTPDQCQRFDHSYLFFSPNTFSTDGKSRWRFTLNPKKEAALEIVNLLVRIDETKLNKDIPATTARVVNGIGFGTHSTKYDPVKYSYGTTCSLEIMGILKSNVRTLNKFTQLLHATLQSSGHLQAGQEFSVQKLLEDLEAKQV